MAALSLPADFKGPVRGVATTLIQTRSRHLYADARVHANVDVASLQTYASSSSIPLYSLGAYVGLSGSPVSSSPEFSPESASSAPESGVTRTGSPEAVMRKRVLLRRGMRCTVSPTLVHRADVISREVNAVRDILRTQERQSVVGKPRLSLRCSLGGCFFLFIKLSLIKLSL